VNFLAHIYLSFGDPEITLGNFMGDSIKGKQYLDFPETIQKGILLHRAIDSYTDAHPIPKISSKRLHSRYSHYSRVIVDIYYDHFLAGNWGNYSEVPLSQYTDSFYALLEENLDWMPVRIKRMAPYMISDNWLLNYRELEGIERVLTGMDRRTGHRSGMSEAIVDLQKYYDEFEREFILFFDELVIFSRQKLTEL